MRAWTFIILRNLFLSQMRRARFKGEWDDITAAEDPRRARRARTAISSLATCSAR